MPRILLSLGLLFFLGCENTDKGMAIDAGLDALRAITLSDKAVREMALEATKHADGKNKLAGPGDKYSRRLRKIVGDTVHQDGIEFNFGVYLSDNVNAFAMANGTVRVYKGLMDMLNDDELRFVVGHEMGHVAEKHILKKIRLSYAASAARKGIASQDGTIGDLARSQIGGLSELLMNAQFSQLEEKAADDYGLRFVKSRGHDPKAAVSALKKLALLGNQHSFLSSHPAPGKRAERLALQLAGKAPPVEDRKRQLSQQAREYIEKNFPALSRALDKAARKLLGG